MKTTSVEFIKSAREPSQYPKDSLPEVAFAGRSNVGKSSLINTLVNRKRLARTSTTPGRTQLINFFTVNNRISFVDLPGYGYAKISKKERERWAPIIEDYLVGRPNLRGCLHLIDNRHEPTEDDKLMSNWLRAHTIATITVATKSDKLSRGAMLKQLAVIRKGLGLFEADLLLPFSAQTGNGRDELWQAITALLP